MAVRPGDAVTIAFMEALPFGSGADDLGYFFGNARFLGYTDYHCAMVLVSVPPHAARRKINLIGAGAQMGGGGGILRRLLWGFPLGRMFGSGEYVVMKMFVAL